MSVVEKLAEKQIAELKSKYYTLDIKIDETTRNVLELRNRLTRITDLIEKQFTAIDQARDEMEKSLKELEQFYPSAPAAIVSEPKTYRFDFTKHG